MSATLRILGCGSSGGVPRIGSNWGQCDPENPKNRRLRCSVLFEKTTENGSTRVLIDTSPDLREQMLAANVDHLDAVVFTHDHADHTHGIDELRVMALLAKKRVPVYFDKPTGETLKTRFGYCFKSSQSGYPPILEGHLISPGDELLIKGKGGKLLIRPFEQEHGEITSLGIRCGSIAYSSDISGVPDVSLPDLADLDTWVVDSLRYDYHPSHFSVKDALQWIKRIAPKTAVLTHLHVDLDYATLAAETPDGVVPAYDGMVIPFDDTAR
ncbi:MAG: MBL fold metallo-hydrolase [Hyphomicrobiaceae bacterium]